jgi:tripartite-type tricarboxylate transporter receptor subunit TctC
MDRRRFMAGCAGRSLALTANKAFAEQGPLTRIVFPFAAGGGDTFCRLLAEHLHLALDRTIIVENRTGR